ncbi:hypothetical protein SAMN05421636_10470 [Pricia antarctica]|uniref:Uncharacterized protein n=1 Tax=Pricia antarctica TaxID=641691 RepID=A0A1G7BCG7_9FLAO|nr:hypothetical protein SAMN05421636_10470 [Pricia antarctica]
MGSVATMGSVALFALFTLAYRRSKEPCSPTKMDWQTIAYLIRKGLMSNNVRIIAVVVPFKLKI